MAKIRDYRIVLGCNATVNERRAAAFLTRNIRLVTGVQVETVTDDAAPQPLEIVVGRTNRENLTGLTLEREFSRQWEFAVFTAGSRVFVTGFGCPKSGDAVAQVVKDGCIGTVYAAYHFVDAILGNEFVYETFDSCPYQPDITMPGEYRFERTCAALAAQLPPAVDGTVMYSVPTYTKAELNQYCLIFKTRAGKIVVIDSGRANGVDHLLRCLYSLTDGEKPVISAWIMTHTHDDHSGGFLALSADPVLAQQVTVEHFYHHLVEDRFYLETAVDRHPDHAAAAHALRKGAADMKSEIHVVQTGDTLEVDELHFEVLYAPDESIYGHCSINDSSLVLKLTHDSGQSMLILVDAEDLASEILMEKYPQKLKSDIVQVAHHGCNGVPFDGYKLVDAKVAFFNCCPRYWYGDNGEGLFTFNVGHIRSRNIFRELGMKKENIYRDSDGILTMPLPFEIK